MNLVARYTLFAVLATALNLGSQELSLLIYSGAFALWVAIAVGTVVGLVSKYVLDKRYIFEFYSPSLRADLGRFLRYTLTGVFTTALFWGLEIGFDYWLETKAGRYTGAIIGLSIGYALKYRLDRALVFVQSQPNPKQEQP